MQRALCTKVKDRVLVTGATGFIGGRLVAELCRLGHPVRALVRDASRAAAPATVEIVQGDLLEAQTLGGVARDCGLVVHCASILGKWGTDEASIRGVNVTGVTNLIRAVGGEAQPPRLVHLSAGGVTGPVPGRSVDETYTCRPATAYERTKLEGERTALALSAEVGIETTVVRPTFTYGPGDPHKSALFRAVRKGRYAFIGDGLSVNHPVYIDDLVTGILLAAGRGRPGEVYIIGGERPVTKRELIHAIADALGVARPRLRIPRWTASAAAAVLEPLGRSLGFEPILTRSRVMMMADNFGYSIAKAARELGYAPRIGLSEGIAQTVESYRRSGVL